MLCVIDFNKSRVVRFAASHWIAFPRSCAGTVRLTLSRSPSSTRAFTNAGARSQASATLCEWPSSLLAIALF